ncbi:MAG: hypothetical protein HY952_09550 [Elusimicrobia bacterium]|nr:hypothetical protein [Elusimicrobiota bacterium]
MIKQLVVMVLIVESLYLSEGIKGLLPFLNLEAVLLVFGGTFLLSWAAYPLKELLRPTGPAALLFAARCAVGMGVLTTVLALMLVFTFPACDQVVFYRRLALSLGGVFYGFLLSKVILHPIAARITKA